MAYDYYRKRRELNAELRKLLKSLSELKEAGRVGTKAWKELYDYTKAKVGAIDRLQKKELGEGTKKYRRRYWNMKHWYSCYLISKAARDYGIEP